MMFNFRALQSMNKFYIYPIEITKYLTNITSNLLVFRTLLFSYLWRSAAWQLLTNISPGRYRCIKWNFRCGKDCDAMYICTIQCPGQRSLYSDSLQAGCFAVRASVEASIFLLPAPVQTGPVPHPFACTLATGSLFLGVKRTWRCVNHPPDLEPRLKK
jgi:hypothetical protein